MMRERSQEILAWVCVSLLVFLCRAHLCEDTYSSCNSYLQNMEDSLPKHYLFRLRRQRPSITVEEKSKLITESLCRFLKENSEKELYDSITITSILLECINMSCPSASSSMEETELVSMENMDMVSVRHFRCMVANITGGDKEKCEKEEHETHICRFVSTSSTAEIKGTTKTPVNSSPPPSSRTATAVTTTAAASRESRTPSNNTLSVGECNRSTHEATQNKVPLVLSLILNVILISSLAVVCLRRRTMFRPEIRYQPTANEIEIPPRREELQELP